jgi:hypothetical protein
MGKRKLQLSKMRRRRFLRRKSFLSPIPTGGGDSSSEIKRRPFVLERKNGGGRGNVPLMLVAIGVILVFGVGMIAFLSTKGTTKRKTATDAAKPNLGRYATPSAPAVRRPVLSRVNKVRFAR